MEKNNSYKRMTQMELTDMKLYESIEENTKELEKLNNDLKRHDNNSAM
jgi:hypothetical protein